MRDRVRMLRAAVVAAAIVLGLCACGPVPSSGAPKGAVTLRYASPYPPTHPFSQADIAWMRKVCDFTRPQNEKDAKLLIDMCRAVDEAPFAVIARIHGNCFGGGLGVVAACDIAVAEAGTRFCFSETRIGIIPAVVSTFVLP